MVFSFMQRRTWNRWFWERFRRTTSDVGLAWRGSPEGPQGSIGLFFAGQRSSPIARNADMIEAVMMAGALPRMDRSGRLPRSEGAWHDVAY
jgi:hypothetical protein